MAKAIIVQVLIFDLIQAMETCGGARVEWEAENVVMKIVGCVSIACVSIQLAAISVFAGNGCAHCEIVTARQQS